MSKADRLLGDYARSKNSTGWVRRILDYDGETVWWCDQFGKGSCKRVSFLNWMRDADPDPNPEEITGIERALQEERDRERALHEAFQKVVQNLRDTLTVNLNNPEWAKVFLASIDDTAYQQLVEAIQNEERLIDED